MIDLIIDGGVTGGQVAKVEGFVLGDQLELTTAMGPLISAGQRDRVEAQVWIRLSVISACPQIFSCSAAGSSTSSTPQLASE